MTADRGHTQHEPPGDGGKDRPKPPSRRGRGIPVQTAGARLDPQAAGETDTQGPQGVGGGETPRRWGVSSMILLAPHTDSTF